MILIADSGSTKTDWCLADNGKIVFRKDTQGLNPFHQDEDEINRIIIEELLPTLGDVDIDEIVFYGSGCRAEKIQSMYDLLSEIFPRSVVEINSDLIAAARAVCGKNIGIACILGTGSNSCFYDGTKVIMNTPPLGYIIGDEGSGAVLGRLFINALYKGELPLFLRNEFIKETHLSLTDIIDNVYCKPLANRFLASLSVFINKYISNRQVNELVVNNFRSFFKRNINPYGRHDVKVGAIGSVAFFYRKQFIEAADIEGYTVSTIARSPMEGLVRFHL
jgi:glucosamine kinase